MAIPSIVNPSPPACYDAAMRCSRNTGWLIVFLLLIDWMGGSGSVIAFEPKEKPARQVIYRTSDPPPKHDDERLAKSGIRKYASKHLQLYTDISPEEAQPLPELMDRVFDAWTDYFGPLPPDREGTEFVMTGYLMADKALFRETGLLPEDLPPFPHGRNKGTRFWMNDQPTPYYRRHLLLHEGTHCFMTTIRNPLRPRVWYMEGMAELFGTHRFDDEGNPHFRVMPHDREQFANLGRIRLVEEEVRQKGPRGISAIQSMVADEFLSPPPYAWSWALCQFLDGHPRHHDLFRKIGRAATTGDKTDDWERLFEANRADLEEEWLLFAANLCHGYDQTLAAIEWRAGKPLPEGQPVRTEIVADRGWQSAGVVVERDQSYQVTARGRFVIAHAPSRPENGTRPPGDRALAQSARNRPWECEPQGISIRYHAGKPLGMLVAAIRSDPPHEGPPRTTMLDVIPIGRETTFTATTTGTLYLRLNDNWSELADNSGKAEVQIRSAPASNPRR
jgi:hypothetical protein